MKRAFAVLLTVLICSRTGSAQIPITIDAQKDTFYQRLHSPEEGCLTLSHVDFLPYNGPKPAGDADLSARIWAAWDSTYFYCYAEVWDDVVRVNNSARQLNDCLELKFDPDPAARAVSGVVSARLTALDSTQAANRQGVDNLYAEAISAGLAVDTISPDNYARRLTPNGYILELRLAWNWIKIDSRSVRAEIGRTFGFAINVHDNDSTGRDGSIHWSSGMADEVWNTPQLLGTAEFLPDHKLKLVKRNSIDPAARPGTTYLSGARLDWMQNRLGADIILENWKYHPGDNSDWAAPDFDDSQWETTATTLSRNNLPLSGWQGVGWFRIHVVVDSMLHGKPLGLFISQAGTSRLYLDGKLLYTFGEENDDWTGLPKIISFAGGNRHVLALRYSNKSVEKYHATGYDAGFYLRLGKPNEMTEAAVQREKTFITMQTFLTAVPLAIGALHMILFAFFPSLKQNLFFALFLFAYAATIFFDYEILLSTDIRHHITSFRLHCAVLPFWVSLQLRFVYSLFYKRLPKQFWIISLIAVGIGALAVYKPIDNFDLFGIVYAVIYVEISRVIGFALFKKMEGTWIIAIAFLVFFIFGCLDLLMDAGVIVSLRTVENPYAFGFIGFFIAMSVYLSRHIARTNKKVVEQEMAQKLLEAENARQSQELEEARQLQLSMLPKTVPALPNLDIAVHMQTATEVGGDYYDFHLADDGALTIAIGDATGHGTKAGTLVSIIKGFFIAEVGQTDILTFFRKATQTIKQMHLGNLYMALMLVKIKGNKMTASSAGIPPIYIYRSQSKSVQKITIKGMPLGGPEFLQYELKETDLLPGDTLLLMSDGFPELFNEKHEMLDYSRVEQIFGEAADKSPDTIIGHLKKAGEAWANGSPNEDDITFVVVKVK